MISIRSIQQLASQKIKDRVLKGIVAGHKGSSLTVTEPGGGSDVAAIKTTARLDGNHLVLNGQKSFITSGMTSDHFVISARSGSEGLSCISLF